MREASVNAPLWLATDPRAVGASLAAQGLLLRLVLAGGSVELLPSDDAEATLAAMVGNVKGAAEAARELVLTGAVRVQHIPDGRKCLALAAPARPATPAVEPPFAQELDARHGALQRRAAPVWQGKPSSSPAARRLRHDRSLFGRRLKGFRNVPAGVSWEDWCTTPQGEDHLSLREAAYPGYEDLALGFEGDAMGDTPGDTQGDTPGDTQGDTPGDTMGDTMGVTPIARASSASYSLVKTTEDDDGEARGRKPGDTMGDAKGDTMGDAKGDTPRVTPPASAPASTTPIFDAIRDGAPHISARSVPLSKRELVERSLAAYPGANRTQIVEAARHASHVEWITKRSQPLPLERLIGEDFRVLGELLDGVRTCPQCRPERATSARPRRAPQAPPPMVGDKLLGDTLRERDRAAVERAKQLRLARERAAMESEPKAGGT